MGRSRVFLALAVALVAAALVAGCGGSKSSSSTSGVAKGKPIVIGAAVDQTSFMKPYDSTALAAAQLEAKKINAQGGVDGHKLVFRVENTQLKPAQTRSAALDLVSKGADILWVTGDVDLSTPSIQVGLSHGLLTVAPYISSDQMGPKRFGSAGKLAFTFGSIAQDEGAALAEFAIKKGWKTAEVVTDKTLAYTIGDGQAFTQRFTQLGGKIVGSQNFTQGDHTIGSVARKVLSQKAQVIFISTIWTQAGDLPAFVSDVRSAGNTTPILGPQGLDGNWMPSNPKISTNVWHTNYSSAGGDDPNPQVNALRSALSKEGQAPASAQFVLGAAAIDALAKAIKQAGGSTNAQKLSSVMQNWKDVPTISGPLTYSPQIHGVTGRPWRMMEIQNGKRRFVEMIKASSPAGL